MDFKIPPIEEQKKIVKEKKEKKRTSFELTEKPLRMLEEEAEKRGVSPSEMLREIIDSTDVIIEDNKRRLKTLTLHNHQIDKLTDIGSQLIPDKFQGKQGANKGAVVEIMLRQFFKDKL